MSHVSDHCAKPRITRHWRRLGHGAVYAFDCGAMYRLASIVTMDGPIWSWYRVAPTAEATR